ncbi:GNAT family N-acetyltransferase [Actinomadura rupiterrae]|uniref:GNAT family N-acetyltransferase n=1 Tax=Actinomadura rupiterrae TaxID=559627 RepID=UPI0020A47A2E|nr:GNAT family protein [Actinomadura rupiterrae]MCP2335490.1 RimJ/RimL family protein N-acetyltransferase [Actinomadura rupiterrae]
MNDAWFDRPVLAGRYVRLEPLTLEHAEGLLDAGKDPQVWRWLSRRQPADLAEMRDFVADALAACDRRERLPWAQIDAATGEVAGTTSFYEIDPAHRNLYIGHTWIGARWQRSGINTESKLLLLEHAFDGLGALRVGWHTDRLNERSRAAIERLGASFEGFHRRHRIRPDGTLRDTAVYAMIDTEWPEAAAALRARLR